MGSMLCGTNKNKKKVIVILENQNQGNNMEESRFGTFHLGEIQLSRIEGFNDLEPITLRVTKNELLLMTEDNYEILGMLKNNYDIEALRV